MRFDPEIYEKVFPRKPETQPIESSVDTFKPTEEKVKAMDHKPGDDAEDPETVEPAKEPETLPEEPEKETTT